MSLALEWTKVKRTGLMPAFAAGGAAAGAFPVLNMIFRSRLYIKQKGDPLTVLLDANWQMMAILDVFLVIIGACILYHIEHEHHGIRKMRTLPVGAGRVFWGKCFLLFADMTGALLIQTAALAFCAVHWFETADGFWQELVREFVSSVLLLFPIEIFMLFISSITETMWICLGIGIMGAFIPLVTGGLEVSILHYFPFSMPLETIFSPGWGKLAAAAAVEGILFLLAEFVYENVRRIGK